MIVLIYKYSYIIIKKDVILSVCVDIIFVGLNFYCINGIIFVLIFGIFFVVIELIVLWYFR